MKKILLSLILFVVVASANAQKEVVINELVPDPGNNDDEYIELFNTTGSSVNLDCYTVVAYDFLNSGAWVYNLPNVNIPAFGFIVISARKPIRYKCGTKDSVTYYNWNAADASASLTYYDRVGNALVNPIPGPTTNFIPIAGGNSAALAVMLFGPTGKLTNGFFTNNGTTIPIEVTTLANLNYTLTGTTCSATAIDLQFSTISAPEAEVLSVQAAVGSSNDYYRQRDGFCGTWIKGQTCNGNSLEFTPGFKNSNLPPINTSTAINIAGFATGCANGLNGTTSLWNISVTVNDVTLLPSTVRIYADLDHNGSLTAADGAALTTATVTTTTALQFPNFPITVGAGAIIQVVTASGCIQVTQVLTTSCAPLPVGLLSFSASRNLDAVLLRWATAFEQNNNGFAIERNTNGSWEQIGFVSSLAMNGNSSSDLSYSFVDRNNTSKGISQYRLRQVDIDAKATYSDVRAVRGEGQIGKITIYPNPTADGKVNILFDDANVVRTVSISDMSGRMVKEVRAISNNNITIMNLQPGMYTVKITVPETGEQAVQKIVVNKR